MALRLLNGRGGSMVISPRATSSVSRWRGSRFGVFLDGRRMDVIPCSYLLTKSVQLNCVLPLNFCLCVGWGCACSVIHTHHRLWRSARVVFCKRYARLSVPAIYYMPLSVAEGRASAGCPALGSALCVVCCPSEIMYHTCRLDMVGRSPCYSGSPSISTIRHAVPSRAKRISHSESRSTACTGRAALLT